MDRDDEDRAGRGDEGEVVDAHERVRARADHADRRVGRGRGAGAQHGAEHGEAALCRGRGGRGHEAASSSSSSPSSSAAGGGGEEERRPGDQEHAGQREDAGQRLPGRVRFPQPDVADDGRQGGDEEGDDGGVGEVQVRQRICPPPPVFCVSLSLYLLCGAPPRLLLPPVYACMRVRVRVCVRGVRDVQYRPKRPTKPVVPRRTSSPLTSRLPKGESGTRRRHMYRRPRTAVASMRTEMTCSAWNRFGPLLVSSFAAVLICA